MTIDTWINENFAPVANTIADFIFFGLPFMGQDIKLIVVWLALAAFFFSFYLGFINFRFFGHAINIIRGKYDDPEKDDGQINRFQALATSLSGTVGLGNIAGVAVAVSVGGPGAVFWMIVLGFFGMSSKFAEVTLGVKYRHKRMKADGREIISGGPMYYLRDGFANKGIPYIGPFLAVIFCICCVGATFGAGNMFQANQAYQQLLAISGEEQSFFYDKGWLVGLFLAGLTGAVILGGLKSIASVASKIVPFMGGLYLFSGLYVILLNYANIPHALFEIIRLAFSPEAGFGGILGALIVGFQRAAFSNEAGIGSAAIVHSTVKTNQPVSQGFVGMLGPFIDTVVICMVTALVIVISGAYENSEGIEGVSLTSSAFGSAIPFFPYILAGIVFLFGFSTMIAWSYYGLKCTTYLFGQNQYIEVIYKLVFCACAVIGTATAPGSIILFSDAMLFVMAIPNVIGLYLLAPELKRDLKNYIKNIENK